MNKLFQWAAGLALLLVVALIFLFPSRDRSTWRLPTGAVRPAMAIGSDHAVILASDGSLWTWGGSRTGYRLFGLGSNIRVQARPRPIGVETNWVKIAAGGITSLALKSDGTLWAWGDNHQGQLGDGTMVRERAIPVHSVPGDDWKDVATAGPHSVALKRDGTLWAWGNNWAGQLGDGTTANSRAPVRVGSSTNWVRIWANLIQNVGQQNDGSLWLWGATIPVPTRVSSDTNWTDVGMGDWMVFAIRSDGALWVWGQQAHRFSGATNVNADASPVRVGTESDWRACAPFSQSRPVFTKRDGSVWVLDGSDQRGVTGRGGTALVTRRVSGLVTNNQLNCVADSTTLGGDPAFGIVKSLEITFQLGRTKRTLTFKENSPVWLDGAGETLTILRAVYGDPRFFRDPAVPSPQVSTYPPPRLRRIALSKDVVAFGGGSHGLGVVLTADGEVWEWGEALGRETRPIRALQLCSKALNRVGIPAQLGDPHPVILKRPTLLEVAAPEPVR